MGIRKGRFGHSDWSVFELEERRSSITFISQRLRLAICGKKTLPTVTDAWSGRPAMRIFRRTDPAAARTVPRAILFTKGVHNVLCYCWFIQPATALSAPDGPKNTLRERGPALPHSQTTNPTSHGSGSSQVRNGNLDALLLRCPSHVVSRRARTRWLSKGYFLAEMNWKLSSAEVE
jgi:hypothetical protein